MTCYDERDFIRHVDIIANLKPPNKTTSKYFRKVNLMFSTSYIASAFDPAAVSNHCLPSPFDRLHLEAKAVVVPPEQRVRVQTKTQPADLPYRLEVI